MKSSPGMRLYGALAFLASALPAANYRLSQGQSFSDVIVTQISPDGLWAVYEQDAQTDEAFELWRVSVEGGSPARVSGLLPTGADISQFVISPDSQTVVYTAPEDNLQTGEIYSASLANPAGKGLKLNGPLSEFQYVYFPKIAADSSRVVFGVTHDGPIRELWSATLDGTDRDPLVIYDGFVGGVTQFLITADSQYVLFVLETSEGISSLLRVPLVGGIPVELSTDLPADRAVIAFDVSPSGTEAVYVANRDDVNRFELFRVPVAGGEPLQISDEGDYEVYEFALPEFSFDGARVIYLVLNDSIPPARELWSVEPDGEGNVRLNGVLATGGTVAGGDSAFEMDPGSSRVVYLASQQDPDNYELYSVPIAGGAGAKLNGPPDGAGDVLEQEISRAGTHVAFRGEIELDDRVDLYATPILGGPSIRLSAVIQFSSTDVISFALPGRGSRAFYMQLANSIISGDTTQRLFATSIGGGQRRRIDGCDAPGELVSFSGLVGSPVQDFRVLYRANQEPDEGLHLYAGDDCVLCTSFEGAWRWSSPEP